MNAARVYSIDEYPDAVAKVQPAVGSKNWVYEYDQNEVEYKALRKVESFPGAPRALSYNANIAFTIK